MVRRGWRGRCRHQLREEAVSRPPRWQARARAAARSAGREPGAGDGGACARGAIGTPAQVAWGEEGAAGLASQVGTGPGGAEASTGGGTVGNVSGARGAGS